MGAGSGDIDPDALKVLYRLRQFDHVAYLGRARLHVGAAQQRHPGGDGALRGADLHALDVVGDIGGQHDVGRASDRSGDYDYTIPYYGEIEAPQLPWLRKYDEAMKDLDEAAKLAATKREGADARNAAQPFDGM